MATILLTSELGGGMGHIMRLLPIARELEAIGHNAIFVLRDLKSAAACLTDDRFLTLQAPLALGVTHTRDQHYSATTYADMLAKQGYQDEATLSTLLRAWDALFTLTRPALIIADHSPTVCLAALHRIPVVTVGDGFTTPPLSNDGRDTTHSQTSNHIANPLLEVIQSVQTRRQQYVPESLASAFSSTAKFLVTFPELDPYRDQRAERHVGPLETWNPPTRPKTGSSVFAYLDARYPGVVEILRAFIETGISCSAYFRNQSPQTASRLESLGVQVYVQPPSLSTILPSVSAIVHHAGLNTSTQALIAGRPQLTLPMHVEQDLNSAALCRLGVASVLEGKQTLYSIGDRLRSLIEDSSPRETSFLLAKQLFSRTPRGSLQHVIDRCRQLI